jgi:flagellar protein FlaI
MDVPAALIANSLDLITLQLKIRVGDKSVRRIIRVSEIDGIDENTGKIKTHDIFKWNPRTDTHEYLGNSVVFKKITERDGDSEDEINFELTKRRQTLEWMEKNNIRDQKEVSAKIIEYYTNHEQFNERKLEA